MFIFRLCFKNNERKSLFIEQKKINKAILACFKVFAKRIDMALCNLDVVFKDNIRLASASSKNFQPASFSKSLIFILALASLLIEFPQQGIPRSHFPSIPPTQFLNACKNPF